MKNILISGALAFLSFSANATFIITALQAGSDVVVSGNGSIDTTGATLNSTNTGCFPSTGTIRTSLVCVGTGSTNLVASPITPSASGFATANTNSTSGTGGVLILLGSQLFLPPNYVSGTTFTNSSTFANQTYVTMGLSLGTVKTFTLPSGDTIVFRVGPAPAALAPTSIPTLSEYGLMALASLMAMAGFAYLRRRPT